MSKEHVDKQLEHAIGLLTKGGLAPLLEISPRTLDSWMKRGFIPYIKIGKSVRFNFEDVLEKLSANRVN